MPVVNLDRLRPGPAAGHSRGDGGTRQAGPTATRIPGRHRRDGRVLAGGLLVLVAAVAGSRAVTSAAHTAPELVAAHDLAPGHLLVAADLRAASVRLGTAGLQYWSAGSVAALLGRPVITPVASGDLLPRASLGTVASVAPTRLLSLPVDPGRLPALAPGDLLDVFATYKGTSGTAGVTVAILRGVEYLGGGDTTESGTVSVEVRVPVSLAAAAVRASEFASLDVAVEAPVGSHTGDVGDRPLSGPLP